MWAWFLKNTTQKHQQYTHGDRQSHCENSDLLKGKKSVSKLGVGRVSQGRDGGNRWPDGLKSKGLGAKDRDKRQSTDIHQTSVPHPGKE